MTCRRFTIIPLALLILGARLCGYASAQSTGAPQESTPNYRAIIAKSLKAKDEYQGQEVSPLTYFKIRGGIFSAKAKIEHVEVADTIRMVQTNYNGWAWQTCIRLNLNGNPVTYAVFIADGSVVDARSAVAIDDCERANYGPLRGATLR